MVIEHEVTAKSIIVKSNLPDTDYVVNPYTGCQFGCVYCYASFMGRFVNEPIVNWGNYIYIKTNSVALFKNDMESFIRLNKTPSILFSSVTDPYQPVEKRYRIVRDCLKIASTYPYQGRIEVLTKSPLVMRDIDVIKTIPNASVGVTITSQLDKSSNYLEAKAPSSKSRLETLNRLNDAGIHTYAFVGPLLPIYFNKISKLEALFQSISQAGTKTVFVEHMNVSNIVRRRLEHEGFISKEASWMYSKTNIEEHKKMIDEVVPSLLENFGLSLRLNKVIKHNE